MSSRHTLISLNAIIFGRYLILSTLLDQSLNFCAFAISLFKLRLPFLNFFLIFVLMINLLSMSHHAFWRSLLGDRFFQKWGPCAFVYWFVLLVFELLFDVIQIVRVHMWEEIVRFVLDASSSLISGGCLARAIFNFIAHLYMLGQVLA